MTNDKISAKIGAFFDKYGVLTIILTVCVLFIFLFLYGAHDIFTFRKNLSACLADGHKEYECRGLLENGRHL